MFNLSVPWWEFVFRGFVVYTFLMIVLRVTGRRQVGQMAPFDLILLLILSDAVQNSMNAGDDSLIGGLISATTLILLNWLVSYASYLSPMIERTVEGQPIVMVKDGKIAQETMRDEKISEAELMMALRLEGCFQVSDVKLALLESNGHVSVWTKTSSSCS